MATARNALPQPLNDNTFNVLVVYPPTLDTEILSRLYGGLTEQKNNTSYDDETSLRSSTSSLSIQKENHLENDLVEIMYQNFPASVALSSLVKQFKCKFKKKVLKRELYSLKDKNMVQKSSGTEPQWHLTEKGKLNYEQRINNPQSVESSSTPESSASCSEDNTSKSIQAQQIDSTADSSGRTFSLKVERKKITLLLREYCGDDFNEAFRLNHKSDGVIYLCDQRCRSPYSLNYLKKKTNTIQLYTFNFIQPATVYEIDGSDEMVTIWTCFVKEMFKKKKAVKVYEKYVEESVSFYEDQIENFSNLPQSKLLFVREYNRALAMFEEECCVGKACLDLYPEHVTKLKTQLLSKLDNVKNPCATAQLQMKSQLEEKMKIAREEYNRVMSKRISDVATRAAEDTLQLTSQEIESEVWQKHFNESLLLERQKFKEINEINNLQMKSQLEEKMKIAREEYNKVMSKKCKNVSDIEFQKISDVAARAAEDTLQLTSQEIESEVWKLLQVHFNEYLLLAKQKFKEINELNIKLLNLETMNLIRQQQQERHKLQMKSQLEEKMKIAREEYNRVMSKKCKNVSDVEFQRISDVAARAAEDTLQLTSEEIESEVWQLLQVHFNEYLLLERKKFKEINELNIKLLNIETMNLLNQQQQERRKIKNTAFIHPSNIHVVNGEAGLLGRGNYGRVQSAFTTAHSAVALKCVKLTGSVIDIGRDTKKFIEELEHCQLASHINVVRIEGYTQHDNHMAIIMEHMTGGTLSSLLYNSNIPISELVQLRICTDIASGLTFLHYGFFTDQRIAHGDIKPQNILLTAELRCKISDFGGSQLATCTGSQTTPRTSHRNLERTPSYAAPEREMQTGLTKAMDVYSVSKVISNVLTRDDHAQSLSLSQIDKKTAGHDSEIFILLRSEMVNCGDGDPECRPKIKEVRDRLLKCLSMKGIPAIAQDVTNILWLMQLKQPYHHENDCVTFDQFQP